MSRRSYKACRLGPPLLLEVACAVEQNRDTLAVLSSALPAQQLAELESVLGEHLGLEQRQRRLLIVRRESYRPRPGSVPGFCWT